MFWNLFSAVGFMPRMQCGVWTPSLILVHTISDALIWLSYMLIPCTMLRAFSLYRQHRFDVEIASTYLRRLLWFYVAFIVSCGFTHFDNIVVFWYPAYRWFGLISLVTAGMSLATVFSLAWIVGKCSLPKLPSVTTEAETEGDHA